MAEFKFLLNAARAGMDPDVVDGEAWQRALDHARREEIMRAIEHIRDVLGLAVLMVTHDAQEAERLATRVVRL